MSVRQIRIKAELQAIQTALLPLGIDYATPAHAQSDFRNKSIKLYGLIKDNRIVAICSVVPDTIYNYLAIKRLVVLNPEDRGKGYAKELLQTVVKRQKGSCGCTPWEDNLPMQKLLAALGFVYQYHFNKIWTFWKIN